MTRQFACAVLLTFLSPAWSYASALTIDVVQAQFDVFLSTTVIHGGVPVTEERTTVSSTAFTDYLGDHADLGGGFITSAEASASVDLFDLSVETRGVLFGQASARVESTVTFIPDATGIQTLALDFTGDNEWYFSSGRVSLFDITTNREAWSYGWDFPRLGTVPWTEQFSDSSQPQASASWTVDTHFVSSHIYRLTMASGVSADSDSELVTMKVSGLQPTAVAEPSVMFLLGSGLAGVAASSRWLGRRRRCR